ncbi:CopD family protein [Magnetospira sp. QH-2]|uniref:CopD family protein n=1 Tax=Magnetospira sp. (strain QH-2) TaxID=1288970 RepID=UPI0003E80B69|nr:CopD family protein [Magnetospira sp. QH-2]CCQ73284.1 Conserved membrane protein of unknown function [Magnetospira sp. QH-2]
MEYGHFSALLTALHALGAIIWVGGMFFAHMALRPAVLTLEPPVRLKLLDQVFPRFFIWVWVAVITLLGTGTAIILVDYDGFANASHAVWTMTAVGGLMACIYAYIYTVPFNRFRRAVAAENWPVAGAAMAVIRRLVGINLILGLLTSAIGASGRFLG